MARLRGASIMAGLPSCLQRSLAASPVSGYGDEWDALGWHRSELQDCHRPIGVHSGAPASPRCEVLWTNFPPGGADLA